MLFQNLSAPLEAGETLHLTGPNGAGKTSLLRIVAGALPAYKGRVLWNGEEFFAENNLVPENILAYLPADDRALKALDTAAENLRFWADFWNLPPASISAALQAMDMVKHKDKPVRLLSAGQRRRLSLARLLLRQAPLWLLDEPFNALDSTAAALFAAALESHAAVGGIAIVASHFDFTLKTGVKRLDLAAFAPRQAA